MCNDILDRRILAHSRPLSLVIAQLKAGFGAWYPARQGGATCYPNLGLLLVITCVLRRGGKPGAPAFGYFSLQEKWLIKLPAI